MTNYEWLVKSGNLADFIKDIKFLDGHALMSEYQMKFPYEDLTYNRIAEWLQAERKTKKYVALDDVIEILRMPRELNLSKPNQKVGMTEIMAMESHHYYKMQRAVFNLEVKEIDE
jgi:hypothetical protein